MSEVIPERLILPHEVVDLPEFGTSENEREPRAHEKRIRVIRFAIVQETGRTDGITGVANMEIGAPEKGFFWLIDRFSYIYQDGSLEPWLFVGSVADDTFVSHLPAVGGRGSLDCNQPIFVPEAAPLIMHLSGAANAPLTGRAQVRICTIEPVRAKVEIPDSVSEVGNAA